MSITSKTKTEPSFDDWISGKANAYQDLPLSSIQTKTKLDNIMTRLLNSGKPTHHHHPCTSREVCHILYHHINHHLNAAAFRVAPPCSHYRQSRARGGLSARGAALTAVRRAGRGRVPPPPARGRPRASCCHPCRSSRPCPLRHRHLAEGRCP